jgi:c-di-GMP-binding flagellar brake protein YcgR
MLSDVTEELEKIINCGVGRLSYAQLSDQLDTYLRELPPERRRHLRLRTLLDVRWRGAANALCSQARLYNLSEGGCLVISDLRVSAGELLEFEIRLPRGRWLPLCGRVVRRSDGVRLGLRFEDLSEQARAEIESLLGASARQRR